MSTHDEFIQRQRAVWAAGKWDDFSNWLAPVTPVVLGQLGDIAGKSLLDVGTGSGGTVAVLGRRDAQSAVMEIAAAYADETGHAPHVFSGSSPGAAAFGHLRVMSDE